VGAGALQTDSRRIKKGDAFIAWPGAATDGRQYVKSSLQAGASCCLVESEGVQAYGFDDARIAQVEGLKAASGLIAAAYYGQPGTSLDVIAVTGTNGKTSSAWWIAQALNLLRKNERSAQYSCGLIGTLGMGTPGNMVSTGLTTPDPVMLQAELARLRDAGASACAMEASSIGIAEHRMAGTQVKVAVFTNFTQDHLDYHGSMEAYWLAKRALFDMPGLQTAVINVDDARGDDLVAYCKSRGLAVISTSQIRTDATLCGSAPEHQAVGMTFDVAHAGQKQSVSCPVVGDFNAANMLGVIGALLALSVGLTAVCQAVSSCTAVPGRMELIAEADLPLMVVDYAHTPDALVKALGALRATAQVRGGKLWCVFGCGGNRDPLKRPLMAQSVQAVADHIILTSDNPRNEAPQTIATEVMAGFAPARQNHSTIHQELDRRQAIRWAAQQAASEDVILIAGKGHEDYQEIAGIKYPFSDIQEARSALAARTRGEAA
jgi:UDP-N-acetylmuramoyl-L-alanyl-D-glutamate--2,6-diaminopimelate ligase